MLVDTARAQLHWESENGAIDILIVNLGFRHCKIVGFLEYLRKKRSFGADHVICLLGSVRSIPGDRRSKFQDNEPQLSA